MAETAAPALTRRGRLLCRLGPWTELEPEADDPPAETDWRGFCRVEALFAEWLGDYLAQLSARGHPFSPRPMPEVGDHGVRDRLLRHDLVRPFRGREAARECGLSVAQFNRVAVRTVGMTPKNFVEGRRKAAALDLLLRGDLQAKEVAFRLGFSSPQHFSRWMARVAGKPPSRFRAEHAAAARTT